MIECTAPLDLLIPAFAYAQRLQPTSYRALIDNFVQYVACNYGDAAYQQVNAVLCHHGATECGAAAPTSCEDCGNGVIEGGEECDGLDWFPYASCEALGFDGGVLACNQCVIDYSGCTFAATDTTAGGGGGPGGGPGGGGPGGGNDVSGDATGDDGGGGGCECRTSSRPLRPVLGVALLVGLLGLRRRSAAVAVVSVAACGPTVDDGGVGTSGAETSGSIDSTGSVTTEAASETTAIAPTLVPEDWIGTYNQIGSGYGEVQYTPIPSAFLQFEIRSDGTCVYEAWHCAQDDPAAAVIDVYDCWFEDGFVRMQPFPGSTYQAWEYVDFYLGPECGTLYEVTVPDVEDYPPVPGATPKRWWRGRLCIVENCDPVVAEDPRDQSPWIYDFCPGEPHDCPCPETGTPCE
jgi:hypothetical protein